MTWRNEEEFKSWYFGLKNPRDQIEALQTWRQYQLEVVPVLINQIRLLANEQYSQIDHFLLELIQNADDNHYPEGVVPKVRVQLQADRLVLQNNEIGFNAENVFAITYAAASTKIRKKHAAMFIGEKGIGFKSVFAVADTVEIHSGPYHFALHDNEYIVPHLLPEEREIGTRIVLHFKDLLSDVAGKLSVRLQNLADGPQEFLLFLRQLRKLTIVDETAGVYRTMRVVEPRNQPADSVLIRPGSRRRIYRKLAVTHLIPASVVATRFRDLNEDLEREVVFAVPVPQPDTREILPDGRLFCFLPTRVKTGLPIHLQSDAKTTTNRENIQDFGSSRWNAELLSNLVDRFLNTYSILAKDAAFRMHLPAYWPINVSAETVGNTDLAKILANVAARLKSEPVVLDSRGHFEKPESVRLVPKRWGNWLYGIRYERAINQDCIQAREGITFVDETWANGYRNTLAQFGVRELDHDGLIRALSAGVPDTVKDGSDSEQREFLTAVMELGGTGIDSQRSALLKSCPIFPLRHSDHREWSSLSTTVFWMRTDTPRIRTTGNTIDPSFTYTPGGTEGQTPAGQIIRKFNSRFRNFLSETLDVPVFSQVEYLRRTLVKDLRKWHADPEDENQRIELNRLWQQVFQQGWRRRSTILKENGQNAFDSLIKDLKEAKIPARPAGRTDWMLVEVKDGFLGRPFVPHSIIRQAYRGTGAPIIQLDKLITTKKATGRRRKKVKGPDWNQWREFLTMVGANTGPYFVERNVVGSEGLSSHLWIGTKSKNWPDLKKAIDEAVLSHSEFGAENASTYRLGDGTRSISLDDYSIKSLANDEAHQFVGRHVGQIWRGTDNQQTRISFTWGQKYSFRLVTTPYLWLHDLLKYWVKWQTTLGLRSAQECFLSTTFNQAVFGDLVPLIDLGPNGYAEEMLIDLGMRGDADTDDFAELIQSWFAETGPEGRCAEGFVPWIEALIKYLELSPDQSVSVQLRVPVYDPVHNQLVGIRDWLNSDAATRFEEGVVARFCTLLGVGVQQEATDLVGELFKIGELSSHATAVCRALEEIGRCVVARPEPEVLGIFRDRLSLEGLRLRDRKIEGEGSLPLVWTTHPVPTACDELLVLRPTLEQRPFVETALRFLGWPSTATAVISIVKVEQAQPFDNVSSRRLHYCLAQIAARVGEERPEIAAKIRSSGLLRSSAESPPVVFVLPKLKLEVVDKTAIVNVNVSYWVDGGWLFLDEETPLEKAVPLFLDRETGSTIAAFFDYVWAASEASAHVESGTGNGGKADHAPPDHPDKRQVQQKDGERDTKSDLDDDIFDDGEDGETDDGNEEKSDDENRDKGKGGPRRRLCSYVIGGGRGRKGETGKSDGSGADSDDTKVEEAGRQRMIAYFDKAGARVESRESENVGYDFEVTIGSKTIYVELKSSKDRWEGWEHGLTRNEFRKALELGEDYYLCTVDRALRDDYLMVFIRDPARSVDLYLFDHPWKAVGLDMNAFIKRLRDAEGLVASA